MSFAGSFLGSDGRRDSHRRPSGNVRRLRLEPLEDRSLLSVGFGPMPPPVLGTPPSLGSGTTIPGAQSTAAATHLSVMLPSSIPADVSVPVQVVALDANNDPTSNYSGTAAVTSSNSNDLLPTTLTFKNGCATFQASFAVPATVPGQDTLTVTDQATKTISGQATVTVTAAAVASQYAISILPPTTAAGQPAGPVGQFGAPTVATGTAVTVQVQAVDAKGQPVTDYSGTEAVTCTDTGTGASCPTSATFVNGVATFQVTFATTGKQSITVTDKTNSITGTLNVNVTTPAVATQYAISILPPAATVQNPAGPIAPPPAPVKPGRPRWRPAPRLRCKWSR